MGPRGRAGLAALALLLASATHAADLTRKAPYLVPASGPGQMKVAWQLTATDTARIEWGLDTSCALGSARTSEYGPDHQHAFIIGGLQPDFMEKITWD